MIPAIDDGFAGLKKLKLLFDFLSGICKIFLVGFADVGKDTRVRQDHLSQSFHFAGHGDACLEQAQIIFFLQQPERQRHANLTVITSGTACDILCKGQRMIYPFLYNGLPVTAGYGNHRDIEFFAVVCGKQLQGRQRVGYHDEIAFRIFFLMVAFPGYYKCSDTLIIQLADVIVTVVVVPGKGKEDRVSRGVDLPAVDEEIPDDSIVPDGCLGTVI